MIDVMQATRPLSPRAIRWLLLGLIGAGLLLGAFAVVDRAMRERALVAEEEAARDNAAILAESLRSELDKFSLLPMALAQDPQVRALLAGGSAEVQPLNLRLEQLARQSGAAAFYVMDAQGLTLAASNWNTPDSFVGSDYAFRRYFRKAMDAGSGTQFALGTVSRKPGLYIAERVGPPDAPLGVVALKVEFDHTEANWRRATQGVYVTDASGVVLIASEEQYRFHLAPGADPAVRDPEVDLRQFGMAQLPPLEIAPQEAVELPLVDAQQPIAPQGWVLHVLVDPGARVAAALATGRLVLVLLVAFSALLALAAWQVRRRRQAREEAIVARRTRTLRDQLSQANRLATLGQISAGVNHEIGQPVAALRVYAESGEKLAVAGESGAAAENFRRIVGLADRIGLITSELRRFSRRQHGERRAVPIGEVIDGALLLLRDRLQSCGVTVEQPDDDLRGVVVQAEHVRLEQVLVNLLQNALDASLPGGQVAIALEPAVGQVQLRVIDHGSGITPEAAQQLFQPFATSKADGLGLGLVISRDIMREMGGDLAYEAERGGTCFTMTIPRPA